MEGGHAVASSRFDIGDVLQDWKKFLTEIFGTGVNTSGITIPEHQPGFDRLVVVPQGMTLNEVLQACRDRFPVWSYCDDDPDRDVTENDREPKETYAIWVRDRVEADEELRGFSVNDLQKRGIPGITLLERLLLELMFFEESGKHLDAETWTLCSGSRHTVGGYVPHVWWGYDGLRVYWYALDDRGNLLRSRQVVS